VKDIVGANFYMQARQEQEAGKDDHIGVSRQVAAGYGINAMAFLPSVSTDQILITADFFDNALFGYRFESLTNTSNLAWDFPDSSDGYESAGVLYPGTKERGFRGLAVDQSGNVFASSRTDNGVYKIARTEFERAKTTDTSKGRNTRGYPKNTATHRLIALDDTTTDEIFPRLGEIVTDCPQAVGPLAVTCGGAVATRAWVLGLGTQKVYRIAVGAATSTASARLTGAPQSILWHPSENILYVAEPEANRVDILDADTLSSITQLANP
jgi:sugar lactone lactonase YvrE